MARPLRLEFPGALYHVTSRGDHRARIFLDKTDYFRWLRILATVCERFNFVVYAYCQMPNHFHIVIETVEGNLSQGMRQLNGLYTQYFNRRHKQVGHLFQGRYKGILIQRESHLLELARYVILNPLRAELVKSLDDWPWSSYHCMTGADQAPDWLNTNCLLGQFGATRHEAIAAYCAFLIDGLQRDSPLKNVNHQLILGDQVFVEQYRSMACDESLRNISRINRRAVAMTLAEYQEQFPDRQDAIAQAYKSTVFTMAEIAAFFGVSERTVSRLIKNAERAKPAI